LEVIDIKRAFEVALSNLNSDIDTAFVAVPFQPREGVPYQKLQHAPKPVLNPTIGDNYYREVGEFQVFLCYPSRNGSLAALQKAQLIRDTFFRGHTLVEGGTTIVVEKTPRIAGEFMADDRCIVPVIITYFASVLK
jgi:hypothetical protein